MACHHNDYLRPWVRAIPDTGVNAAGAADAARRLLAASPWPGRDASPGGRAPRTPTLPVPAGSFNVCRGLPSSSEPPSRTPGPPRLRLTSAARFAAAEHPGWPTKIQWVGTEERATDRDSGTQENSSQHNNSEAAAADDADAPAVTPR